MNTFKGLIWLSAISMLVGCAGEEIDTNTPNKEGSDLLAGIGGDTGKADGTSSARILDDVSPDALVKGTFDPRTRVYGYIVEARKGATLSITLSASAGEDAQGPKAGAALDTRMGIYGPFETLKKPGRALGETDDSGDVLAAPPISVTIQEDAKYLVAFSSWEDTGTGDYTLEVACEGTDLQCRRPQFVKPCKAGQLFIQGNALSEDTTWETCDVVILEPLSVPANTILTIRPGVTVRSNFIGGAPFGNVGLDLHGTLQAVGTPEHPIVFTAFKEGSGWRGITLRGKSSSIEHAIIERASVGITLNAGASANISDTLIEGITINNRRSHAGITAQQDVEATFVRALVKGFDTGLILQNAQKLAVEDSIIRENNNGVLIRGQNRINACPSTPPAPARRFRDPTFIHTDIVHNTAAGILIQGSDLLVQVEHSNIINNGGLAISVEGTELDPASFIRNNNIHSNNGTNLRQIRSFHLRGTLDISHNFWNQISDPELSQSWQIACRGPFSFTGFSPEAFGEAGPREEKLVDPIQKQTFAATQN